MRTPTRSESLERALRPAGGTVSDDELRALGSWAQPAREHRSAWAARVRQLLAESPLRDLASAAIQARAEVGRGMAAAARRGPQEARSERGRVAEDLDGGPDVARALATCRARWTDPDVDALELERVLKEALPQRPDLGAPRTQLLVIDGRARAFERVRFDRSKRGAGGGQGAWIWRSMYVRTANDVRRAAGAAR